MSRSASHPPALKLHLALNAAALFSAAVLMALIARSSGFSTLRVALISGTALLGLAAVAAAIFLHSQPATERRLTALIPTPTQPLGVAIAIAFLIFWCLTWFPPQYTADRAYYYFIGLYPILLCGLLLSGSALILSLVSTRGSSTEWWFEFFRARRVALQAALLALLAFALIALLVGSIGILKGYEPFWYGAGVPLLAAQVLAAAVLALLASAWESESGARRIPTDAVFFFVIWAAAAALWAAHSVPPSYWLTAPQPPNFENYPFSDAITYDVASQFALIGQGIFNGAFFDRALYMSFLLYLHTLGGQNYQTLMAIQAALFAVFPALLYLIGRQLHSRGAGLTLAALITLRGLNSLRASTWIDTATFKHMLTDFPTAIVIAASLLFLLRWSVAPRERRSDLLWAAGILGLGSLLRPHVLLWMAGIALLALWLYRSQWKMAVSSILLASVAFLAPVLPWMMLGPSSGGLLGFYGQRVQDVIAQRYPGLLPTATAPSSTGAAATAEPSKPAAAAATVNPVPAATESPRQPASIPTPAAPRPVTSAPPADPGPPFVVDHFLHNLVTSAMILPSSPQLLSTKSVVKEGEKFWRPRWDGGMSPLSTVMLGLNLALVAFGIGAAVQRDRLRGWIPAAGLLLYFGANSFARTSGGRYIVPVDWIVVCYFAVALSELGRGVWSFARREPVLSAAPGGGSNRGRRSSAARAAPSTAKSGWLPQQASRPALILIALLLIGGLVPLAGVLYPAHYANTKRGELLQQVRSQLPQLANEQELKAFLKQPNAMLVTGRVLYPIYYRKDEGEPTRYPPYAARAFPRTVFVLIGSHGTLHVLLPGTAPDSLPNTADALVLGCRFVDGDYVLLDALAVVLPGRPGGLLRNPEVPLQCPIPKPTCDNNSNCW